mgnify:CR=1 FL=1
MDEKKTVFYVSGERRIDMSTKRDEAIRYLSWYLKLLFEKADLQWDASNDADIECIIDLIIDAAILELTKTLKKGG